ncbi:MAG TPA: hypothetical protein VEF72_31005 [Mycobacterium sp.]|nr:hypothetical protein [Mycobacterium sp.]
MGQQMHRGTEHTAAHYFRMILANDDRAHTMHTVAARTEQFLHLPLASPVVHVVLFL